MAALVAASYAATQIDAVVVYVALALSGHTEGLKRAYAVCHVTVIGLAYLLSLGAAQIPAGSVRYLGLIPLGIGLWMLYQQRRESPASETSESRKVARDGSAYVASFLALSVDSVVVAASFFADSGPASDFAVTVGLFAGVALLLWLASWASQKAQSDGGLLARAEKIAPYFVIAAGIYVLLDTGTDIQ